MISQLLQIIIFQLIFLCIYEILYTRNTFFQTNRAYLLLTSILSLLLPWISLPSESIPLEIDNAIQLPTAFINTAPLPNDAFPMDTTVKPSAPNIPWIWIIYSIGVLISVCILVFKLISLKKINISTTKVCQGYKLKIITNSKEAFTLFNTIYLGDQINKTDQELILKHELVHLKQKHSLDLILFEILKIIFWFNPCIYWYQHKIKTVHEFIADKHSQVNIGKRAYFEQLLNQSFQTEEFVFSNTFFNQKLIKKRILMMQKKKTKTYKYLLYTITIPFILVMLTLTAFTKLDPQNPIELPKTTKNETPTNIVTPNGEVVKISSQLETPNQVISKKHYEKEEQLTQQQTEVSLPLVSERNVFQKNIPQPKAAENITPTLNSNAQEIEVPFMETDKVPSTKKCIQLSDKKLAIYCFSNELNEFIIKNFDLNVTKGLGIVGEQRIYARFKIDTDGHIQNIEVRGSLDVLEKEARRVLKLLPQMIPGEKDSKKVNVLYSLPIAINIPAIDSKKKLVSENRIAKEDDYNTVLTDILYPREGVDTPEEGYYLVTGIFKKNKYKQKSIKKLKEMGLSPKYFTNPRDNYDYVYLETPSSLKSIKKIKKSIKKKHTDLDTYILKIEHAK